MMKKNLKSIVTVLTIAAVTLVNFHFNELFDKENRIVLADLFAISQASAECGDSGATVPCLDAESYGSGVLRDRICVDTQNNCLCDWEDHWFGGLYGTCTP